MPLSIDACAFKNDNSATLSGRDLKKFWYCLHWNVHGQRQQSVGSGGALIFWPSGGTTSFSHADTGSQGTPRYQISTYLREGVRQCGTLTGNVVVIAFLESLALFAIPQARLKYSLPRVQAIRILSSILEAV